MPLYGADISEFQGALPDGDFIIIRAHSGYREDLRFQEHWEAAKGRYRYGRGVYGYVVPDRDPAWQAQQLLELTAGDLPEFGFWSDIEQPGLGHDVALAHIDHLRQVEHPGFYSNVPDYLGILGSAPELDDLPWWVAGYGPNDGDEHPLRPAPPRPFLIHQFTSRWQGQSLDGNVADEPAIQAWLGSTPKPDPGPEIEEDDDVKGFITYDANGGTMWFCRGGVRSKVKDKKTADKLKFLGQAHGETVTLEGAELYNLINQFEVIDGSNDAPATP